MGRMSCAADRLSWERRGEEQGCKPLSPIGDGDPATSLEKTPQQGGQRQLSQCTVAAEEELAALSFMAPGGHGHGHLHGVMVTAPNSTSRWPCTLPWGGLSAHQGGKQGSCMTSHSQNACGSGTDSSLARWRWQECPCPCPEIEGDG